MKRSTTHPNRKNRQRSALEQRQRQLAAWKGENSREYLAHVYPVLAGLEAESAALVIEDKIATCEADIASLKTKLRIS